MVCDNNDCNAAAAPESTTIIMIITITCYTERESVTTIIASLILFSAGPLLDFSVNILIPAFRH